MMNKDWVHLKKGTNEYKKAVDQFVEYAKSISKDPNLIICPCTDCKNLCRGDEDMITLHLRRKGMDMTYTNWIWHGEEKSSKKPDMETVETNRIIEDAYVQDEIMLEPTEEVTEDEFSTFLKGANTPLYPGCTKYTRLYATVIPYKHKSMYGVSDKCFSHLLEILRDMLSDENTIPESARRAKDLFKPIELGCEKIHACPNDCCLYRKDLTDEEKCKKCNASRWKIDPRTKKIRKGVPAKVLRYFPIIPRFKRMFETSESAENLIWHQNHKSEDGKMRHPVDSLVWKTIDKKYPSFAGEPRNIRFGLASDGFNPFGNMSSTYSCWPVMLVNYNLPPWLSMSKEHMMLSLLIPGPKQPGNDIDVYLQPLIDDMLELWNTRVETYDSFTKSAFNLKAIMMWTINDFPAYGNLSGSTTKGKLACPICGPNTRSQWLKFSRKTIYNGHRRFLPKNHSLRKKRVWFDGNQELEEPPRVMTGSRRLNELKDFHNDFGKGKGKEKRNKSPQLFKKRSCFYQLPYYEHLPLPHNLDVMHVEKNWCDATVGTLLNVKGKSKDGIEARRDLEEMGIRHELHPELKGEGKRTFLPPGPHNLSKKEAKIFCDRLFHTKLPDGYCSNIGNCVQVDECKITGLKSHDCHVLMQQLLPVALRGLLPKGPRNTIFRICVFFNTLCQRVIDREEIAKAEEEVIETLCMFERFFPPSFFDIMIHLAVHLGREARLGGPVHYRWMYPFERFLKTLKRYVRNRARPEGCIEKCYLADECMRYFSAHVKQVADMDNRRNRNDDVENDSVLEGRPISKGVPITMSQQRLRNAHRYVLFNTAEVEPYLEMHLEELKLSDKFLENNETLLQDKHSEEFSAWLKEKIGGQANLSISNTLKWLAHGPSKYAMSYSGYIINGHRFHRKDAEKSTQNSGVSLEATTISRSGPSDMNQAVGTVGYYGFIKDIILLDYYTFQIPIFDCDWASATTGVKLEEGLKLVNLHQGQREFQKDPFILASQATQVFYSREYASSSWYVVLKAPPRGFRELDMDDEDIYTPTQALDASMLDENIEDEQGDSYLRKNCEGTYV